MSKTKGKGNTLEYCTPVEKGFSMGIWAYNWHHYRCTLELNKWINGQYGGSQTSHC